jgi:hypothetical protein
VRTAEKIVEEDKKIESAVAEALRIFESRKKAEGMKMKTIACVKGNLSKKVTGLTPKCPKGFKKK